MHHPLTQQPTRSSLLSWWSDSNPSGPTISLHAATKPLMRLMYHRQALAFIRKNRGIQLSKDTLEIYSSYLVQICIVSDKGRNSAGAVSESKIYVYGLGRCTRAGGFTGPDPEVSKWTCSMVGRLMYRSSLVVAVLSVVNPCPQLIVLVRDGNVGVSDSAAYTLYHITATPQGAQAAVDAKLLTFMAELRQLSKGLNHQRWALDTLELLGCWPATAPAALEH
ncbi:hypothetical protein FB451DRAFT_65169 [Mycena latifolia]|nr:hypothetical protein FB451DRAFT_65169 [Mycena latifolia]